MRHPLFFRRRPLFLPLWMFSVKCEFFSFFHYYIILYIVLTQLSQILCVYILLSLCPADNICVEARPE